jgi:LmbE family N-acetylglucosaminyl deacetylase
MVQPEKPYRRGMVVFAHADDAEYGSSGTVAKWCAEGWDVVYLVCTDGSKGSSDPEMSADRLVKVRQEEQRNAGKVLGLQDVVFLGFEDSMLEPSLTLRRDIAREIRRHKPDVLICPSPFRQSNNHRWLEHPDHLAAGEAAMAAVFPTARDRLTFPELLEEGLEPHKVREVWVPSREDADCYVDVTDYIEVSVQALKQHKSQLGDFDSDSHMREWRGRTGDRVGFQYAESFKRIQLS